MESGSRVDVYLFFSFDLAGANRLKAQLFDRFHWVELFRHFHHECQRLIASRGIADAVIWKYLDDRVLFYQRIGTPYEVEHSIRAIDRALNALGQELTASAKYAAAAEFVSPRAIAWLAPVVSFSDDVSDQMADLVARLEGLELLPFDQMVHDRENGIVDFLGPNIDTGFQLALTARLGQITISAELADFLRGSERPVLDAVLEAGS